MKAAKCEETTDFYRYSMDIDADYAGLLCHVKGTGQPLDGRVGRVDTALPDCTSALTVGSEKDGSAQAN